MQEEKGWLPTVLIPNLFGAACLTCWFVIEKGDGTITEPVILHKIDPIMIF